MPQETGFTEGRVTLKSGKLIRVWARFKRDEIQEIRITGDFFIYPEDAIENLERALKRKKIKDVKKISENVLQGCEYIGIDAKTIQKAVIEAWMKKRWSTSSNIPK